MATRKQERARAVNWIVGVCLGSARAHLHTLPYHLGKYELPKAIQEQAGGLAQQIAALQDAIRDWAKGQK